jgi:beta-fructofuranosidase
LLVGFSYGARMADGGRLPTAMKKWTYIAALLLATLAEVAAQEQPRDYTSKAPRFTFADSLAEQESQLKNNPLLLRFREARRKQQGDPHAPRYHFSSPEARLNDPNGLCFWQGRWHLFYQANPPEDGRWHWAHAVSEDLIHWRDLPFAIFPNPEEQCYSGSVLVEEHRVIAMYHGRNLGNMVAVSRDPLLLNWEKVTGGTVIPLEKNGVKYHFLSAEPLPYRVYDCCIWKKDGVYYSLSGSVEYSGPAGKPVPAAFLFRSRDLATWEFVHQFLEGDRFTRVGDDAACPYFWPIGDRHILLFFSHTSSGQYLLGDYDRQREKFASTAHGRFNFGAVSPGGVHAPSATPDGKGGVIVIFNVNPAMTSKGANGIMSLPRRLTLLGKDELGQEPAGDIESLRGEHQHVAAMPLPANEEIVLPNIRGNTLEIIAEIDSGNAPLVELNVLRSTNAEEVTRIALLRNRSVTSRFMPPQQKLSVVTLDNTRSSLLSEALSRPPETAPVFISPDEPFKLRVFVDRSIVEVFVNGRQCLALRVHPSRADSPGVSLRAQGQPAKLRSLDAWKMKSIQP